MQTAAGYVEVSQQQHPTTSRKRQLFVKACVKLILQLVNRYKSIFSGHHLQMESTIGKMLDKMEAVITASKFKYIEAILNFVYSILKHHNTD